MKKYIISVRLVTEAIMSIFNNNIDLCVAHILSRMFCHTATRVERLNERGKKVGWGRLTIKSMYLCVESIRRGKLSIIWLR